VFRPENTVSSETTGSSSEDPRGFGHTWFRPQGVLRFPERVEWLASRLVCWLGPGAGEAAARRFSSAESDERWA
jgi:hypothetical protein